MKNDYQLPIVRVLSVKHMGDIVITEIEILTEEKYFGKQIAPGNLLSEYAIGVKSEFNFPVHKVVKYEKKKVTFETYNTFTYLPLPKKEYLYLSNFIPSQMELVKDTTKKWQKKLLPDTICTCDLTWVNTHGKENLKHYWYTDGEHWITPEAYENYIKKDILRVRKDNAK